MQTDFYPDSRQNWQKALKAQEDAREGAEAFILRPSRQASLAKEAQDLLDKIGDYDGIA